MLSPSDRALTKADHELRRRLDADPTLTPDYREKLWKLHLRRTAPNSAEMIREFYAAADAEDQEEERQADLANQFADAFGRLTPD